MDRLGAGDMSTGPAGAGRVPAWNPSQVVAFNMARARGLRGLTQAEVAEGLSRLCGARWSKTTVAQAEGSVTGTRVRAFTAVELVALARVFDLPVVFFFAPPDEVGARLAVPGLDPECWESFVEIVAGHDANSGVVADRFARFGRCDVSPTNWATTADRELAAGMRALADVLEGGSGSGSDVGASLPVGGVSEFGGVPVVDAEPCGDGGPVPHG